jgi:uncharacterized protein
MMAQLSQGSVNINWMLSNFVETTAGVEQAIAVSSDGLLMAISSNLERSSADKMAAVVTGMRSLSDGAARVLNKGGLNQVIVEMAGAYLFVSAISGGSAIGVVSSRNCDLGLVGYEITVLVSRFATQLTPELIAEMKNALVTI